MSDRQQAESCIAEAGAALGLTALELQPDGSVSVMVDDLLVSLVWTDAPPAGFRVFVEVGSLIGDAPEMRLHLLRQAGLLFAMTGLALGVPRDTASVTLQFSIAGDGLSSEALLDRLRQALGVARLLAVCLKADRIEEFDIAKALAAAD